MKALRLVLADQLSLTLPSLVGYDSDHDSVIMCEVWQEASYVNHHKKKIAFLFSAMRHFAQELEAQNFRVHYSRLDDSGNSGSLKGEIKRLLERQGFDRVIVTSPGEYRLLEEMQTWQSELGLPVEIRADDRFLYSIEDFAQWASQRKQPRMEYFYREVRKKYQILMEQQQPLGGQWNYDSENRKPPRKGLDIPDPHITEIDDITQQVIQMVAQHFEHHFGDLTSFYFATTRDDARKVLAHFIEHRLPHFGDYQDAMLEGEPWMYHSHISFYLNCGLLTPLECVHAAEQAFHQEKAPINAVEGFIRQIIGWREYIRGIYWLKMPAYKTDNYLEANRALPNFYWSAKTDMNCLHQCVKETQNNAYAHHIQRLMVLGNFALLAGIDPLEVNEWFLAVYADAYEWVELPNVTGMVLFADGGYLASKPYAAGGNYINKMSNYCRSCRYQVKQKHGPEACPFNYLYWDFLDRNRPKLQHHQRISMMYRTWDRMEQAKQHTIREESRQFLEKLDHGHHV